MNLSVVFLAVALAIPSASASSAGDVALQRGDFGAAYAAYRSAVAAAPGDPDGVLGLGTIDLYRNDLTGARSYLSKASQLLPNDPRVQARLRALSEREPSANDFQISMQSPEVDVPFIATDPLPLLHARINGVEATLVLDTGATGVDLTASGARRLGITTYVSGNGVFAGGRTMETRAGRIDRFAVPGVTVRGIPAHIVPGAFEMAGKSVDGSIGTTFLRHFLSTIDYAGGRLILRPRSTSASFESAAARRGAAIAPMWLVSDHFLFTRARVNDAPEALFNIDTGGEGVGVQLTKDSLDAAHIAPDASKPGTFDGPAGATRTLPFTAASVKIGSFAQNNVPGIYFPDGDQYGIFPFTVAGSLSQVFFRTAQVTFDFDAMKMIVLR